MGKSKSMNAKKEKDMTKELTVKPDGHALAVAQASEMDEWGGSPISAKDLVIPRIDLMNGLSKQVTEGNAAFGEFRDSLTNRKLGDLKTPFEIVPFMMRKFWVDYEKPLQGKKIYLRQYPVTPQNEDQKYERKERNEAGREYIVSSDYVLQFFVLLAADVKEGSDIPYLVTFRRTSLKEGKKLATQMYVTNRGGSIPPAGKVVSLRSRKESNAENSWAVPEVLLDADHARMSDAEYLKHDNGEYQKNPLGGRILDPIARAELNRALYWLKRVQTEKPKVDEDLSEDDSTPVEPSNASVGTGPSRF